MSAIWSEWQHVAPGSPWQVEHFIYRDLPTDAILEIGDVGQDENFAGGFYLYDDVRDKPGELLGIELDTGLVWWGELQPVFDSYEFDKYGLQGHLNEVVLRGPYVKGRGYAKLRCQYAAGGPLL